MENPIRAVVSNDGDVAIVVKIVREQVTRASGTAEEFKAALPVGAVLTHREQETAK
jgi:hypothetical protein